MYQMKADYQLYLLILPIVAYFIIFKYFPIYGLKIAFLDYDPALGFEKSIWVGFDNFMEFFTGPYFELTLKNTLVLSFYSLLASMPIPILFALVLNSFRDSKGRKAIQTITYAPHFISTIVIVGMLQLFLSPSSGIINRLVVWGGGKAINFLGEPSMFRHVYVWSGIWQNLGWDSVIYLAALSSVNPELHEAAQLDGANRIQRMRYIDLPGILPTIVILLILHFGSIMSVGFEKVYLLQNTTNSQTSEIIATYTYKQGIQRAQYGYSAAVGMFNSVVNLFLLTVVNKISKKVTEVSLW
ncbi:MAG: sugar ABC transporter permease [Lachnospiraceae bacterium]|nr:sugar ABC transporter permease [Lachnospiraceae bacterium]